MPNQKGSPVANESGNFVRPEKVDRYWRDNASSQQVNYYKKINNNEIDSIMSYAFFSLGIKFYFPQ